MGRDTVHFVRETLATTNLSPREIRRVLAEFKPRQIARILWLTKSSYLVVSTKPHEVVDGKIDSDDIVSFVKEAVHEVQEFGRLAAVLHYKDWTSSAFGDRLASFFDESGKAFHAELEQKLQSTGPQVPVTFKYAAIQKFTERPEGVRLYFEANRSKSSARRIADYFRVIEAGFGQRGSRLSKPLRMFLDTGSFKITQQKWDDTKKIRDQLSHAYRAKEVLYESDASPHVQLFQSMAADVLAHKKNWGSGDSDRLEGNMLAGYKALDGTIVMTQGYGFSMTLQMLDPVTGIPVLLEVDNIKKNYRRYAERFLTSMKVAHGG